jgi:hypothetical protein
MEQSTKSIATNYGLYLGGLLGAITVLGYAAYLELFTQWWFTLFIFITVIIFGVISVSSSKKAQNGVISFKECFTSWLITVALGVGISALITFMIFGIIDPEAAETLKQSAIEASINMMEGFGTSADVIAEAVDKMEQQDNFSIATTLMNTAVYIVILSVVGLIVSLIMKRSDDSIS